MKVSNIPAGTQMTVDDLGIIWIFLPEEERICCLEEDGSPCEGGYWCNSLEDGISYLIEDGYVTR